MKTLSVALLVLIAMSGQLNANNHSAADNKITLNLDDTSEILVKGFIAPVGESLSDNFKQWDELVNLRVAEPEKQHPASVFQAFLPKNPVSVGELWVPDMIGIVNLFKQLHPNPNFFLHINAGDSFGLWACLRGYNAQYADIVFRIHAEFKLKDGWFTPSQSQKTRETKNMKITKLVSLIPILTLAVFLANGWAGDLPVGAIARIDVGEGPVNAIAYSRSTNRVAVAAANSIYIYDASTYEKQMVFTEHTDSVLAVAFSPNGKRLVSGGLDKTVRLWYADTGKLRNTREEHKAPVNTVAFSPDGKRFWSGSSENDTIRSWHARDGGRWSSQTSPRTNLTFIVIACSYKGANVAKVFDGTPSECLIERIGSHWHVVSGHTDPVSILTLYEDGKTVATGSADKTIEVWNKADTDKPIYTLTGHTGGITAMDFSVDAKLLASASSDKTVRLWDLTTGHSLQTFTGHTSEVGAVIFLEDKALAGIALAKAKILASGDSDGTVFIWDME